MGAVTTWAKIVSFFLVWYVVKQLYSTPQLPYLDPDPYWGPEEWKPEDIRVKSFIIDVPKKDVEDLKTRLSLPPRFAPPLEGANFTYGVNSLTMAVFLEYWKNSYDWKKREKRLNTYKHFKTRIEGLNIHFLRAAPPANSNKTVRPLLLLHGWPGSFADFMDILPLLTTPRPDSDVVFDVVCPSLPGYGFSEAAAKPGLNTLAMAQIFTKLMKRLGFEKFYVQGCDWGSTIASDISTVFPQHLYGLHVNVLNVMTNGMAAKLILGAFLPSGMVIEPTLEKTWYPLSKYFSTVARETGYTHIQATKPDTIGIGLNSSPLGLAAYILEKFSTKTDYDNVNREDGGLLDPDFPFPLEILLDNICIYWFTGTITSSMRLYSEALGPKSPSITLANIPTSVPAGLLTADKEFLKIPKNLATQKLQNLVSYTLLDSGGHIIAIEAPKLLADDVFKFVNIVENQLKDKKPRAFEFKKCESSEL